MELGPPTVGALSTQIPPQFWHETLFAHLTHTEAVLWQSSGPCEQQAGSALAGRQGFVSKANVSHLSRRLRALGSTGLPDRPTGLEGKKRKRRIQRAEEGVALAFGGCFKHAPQTATDDRRERVEFVQ